MMARAYFVLCMAGLAVLLGTRLAYYTVPALPSLLLRFNEALMQFHVRAFMAGLALAVLEALVILALVLRRAFRGRPHLRVEPAAGASVQRALRPWVYVLGGTLCLHHHYVFDADPFMAPLCWTSLALVALWFAWGRRLCAMPASRWGAAALALAALAACFWWAPDPACATAVAVWTVCVTLIVWLGTRVLRPAAALFTGVLLLPVGVLIFPILFAGVIPGALRPLAHVMESQGYAYNYCEFPERHRLFLSVPSCATGKLEGCERAYVAEYDTEDFSKRTVHQFFDASFTGGLRELLCVGDVVQVTMNLARLDGVLYLSNVMEFDAGDPSRFRRTIYAPDVLARHTPDLLGHRYAYDRKRDAVLYSSEWSNTVFRLDRKTGMLDERAGDRLPPKPFQGVLRAFGLFISTAAIHEGRDSLFLSQWADGSDIYEMDLGTLALKSVLTTHDTGSFGTTVDEKYDRLIASGLWGINVFDLKTGALLLRERLGPGVRDAQLDDRHDLVYLGTTLGGSVWVLDRATLATLGRLPTGVGGRRPYVSADGRWLFVTDQHYTYRYDTDDVAHWFRGGTR